MEELLEQTPMTDNEQQPMQQEVPTETAAERNFRLMRDKYVAQERRLKELEAQQQQRSTPPPSSDDYDPYDDTFIDRKTLKKEKAESDRQLREIREELMKVNNHTSDMKLRVKFNDFDHVVNAENLEKLSVLKPSHYKAVSSTSDYYAAGETAYDLIKAFVVPQKTAAVDQKLAANANKPRTSGGSDAYVSNSPLTMAADYDRRTLSPERKKQLLAQVAELKKYG